MWYGQIIQGYERKIRIVPLIIDPPFERIGYVLDRMTQVIIDLTDGCHDGYTNWEVCEKQHTDILLDWVEIISE